MTYTLSLHGGNSKVVHQAHNIRDYMPHNANPARSGDNIILEHIPVRDAYHKMFDDAVTEYNKKQIANRHKNRIIKDYYSHINSDSKKQTAYEIIIQIGGRADGGAPDQAIDALVTYYSEWSAANPNLKCIGAYIHQDEPGTIHLHLDYIPYAKCKRGMYIQNTLTGALKAQGFITRGMTDTAQMQWEQAERDRFRNICESLGISVAKQGIGRKRHLTVDEYKKVQDNIHFAEQQLSAVKQQISTMNNNVKELNRNIEHLKKQRAEFDIDYIANMKMYETAVAFQQTVTKHDPNYARQIAELIDFYGNDVNNWPDHNIDNLYDEMIAYSPCSQYNNDNNEIDFDVR